MVHYLGPMMYDPNGKCALDSVFFFFPKTLDLTFYFFSVFTLNLEQLLAGAALDTAIGVLQVTIHNARGLKDV